MRPSEIPLSNKTNGRDPEFEKINEIRVKLRDEPEEAIDYIPWLATQIDAENPEKRKCVIKLFYEVSEEYPVHVLPVTIKLFTHLETEDNERVVNYIFKTLNNLVEIKPSIAQNHVESLKPYILDKNSDHRNYATYLLNKLSKENQDAPLPIVERIAKEQDPELLDINTLAVIGRTTKNHPEIGNKFTDTLINLVESSEGKKRANALGVLADISNYYTEKLGKHSDRWIDYLDDRDSHTRFNSVYILRQISIEDSEKAVSGEDKFQELLSDEFKFTRLNACIALAEIGSTDSLDKIRELEENDESKKVRDVAKKAVKKLEGGNAYKL
ncbi:MAG: HEAT repeat domain-containing protein [Halobacteria archaeon]